MMLLVSGVLAETFTLKDTDDPIYFKFQKEDANKKVVGDGIKFNKATILNNIDIKINDDGWEDWNDDGTRHYDETYKLNEKITIDEKTNTISTSKVQITRTGNLETVTEAGKKTITYDYSKDGTRGVKIEGETATIINNNRVTELEYPTKIGEKIRENIDTLSIDKENKVTYKNKKEELFTVKKEGTDSIITNSKDENELRVTQNGGETVKIGPDKYRTTEDINGVEIYYETEGKIKTTMRINNKLYDPDYFDSGKLNIGKITGATENTITTTGKTYVFTSGTKERKYVFDFDPKEEPGAKKYAEVLNTMVISSDKDIKYENNVINIRSGKTLTQQIVNEGEFTKVRSEFLKAEDPNTFTKETFTLAGKTTNAEYPGTGKDQKATKYEVTYNSASGAYFKEVYDVSDLKKDDIPKDYTIYGADGQALGMSSNGVLLMKSGCKQYKLGGCEEYIYGCYGNVKGTFKPEAKMTAADKALCPTGDTKIALEKKLKSKVHYASIGGAWRQALDYASAGQELAKLFKWKYKPFAELQSWLNSDPLGQFLTGSPESYVCQKYVKRAGSQGILLTPYGNQIAAITAHAEGERTQVISSCEQNANCSKFQNAICRDNICQDQNNNLFTEYIYKITYSADAQVMPLTFNIRLSGKKTTYMLNQFKALELGQSMGAQGTSTIIKSSETMYDTICMDIRNTNDDGLYCNKIVDAKDQEPLQEKIQNEIIEQGTTSPEYVDPYNHDW